MRVTVLALALAALVAAPASAQQAGQPQGAPFPNDVDNSRVPMGDTNGLFGAPNVEGGISAMSRLRQICEGRSTKDRMTCNRAWREIRAAYAQMHGKPAPAPTRD